MYNLSYNGMKWSLDGTMDHHYIFKFHVENTSLEELAKVEDDEWKRVVAEHILMEFKIRLAGELFGRGREFELLHPPD
jgi:phosphatidylethanolamine-binding protein (PEBP) family uncharacterized protein